MLEESGYPLNDWRTYSRWWSWCRQRSNYCRDHLWELPPGQEALSLVGSRVIDAAWLPYKNYPQYISWIV